MMNIETLDPTVRAEVREKLNELAAEVIAQVAVHAASAEPAPPLPELPISLGWLSAVQILQLMNVATEAMQGFVHQGQVDLAKDASIKLYIIRSFFTEAVRREHSEATTIPPGTVLQ